MSEHHHVRIARTLWDAAASGDPGPALALYDPGVVWRSYGRNRFCGEYRGLAEVNDYLARLGGTLDSLRSELRSIYGSDAGAIIHYHSVAQLGPRTLAGDYLLWLRIAEGLIEEVALIPFDQAADDAFWRTD